MRESSVTWEKKAALSLLGAQSWLLTCFMAGLCVSDLKHGDLLGTQSRLAIV